MHRNLTHAFWDVAPCSTVDTDVHFRGAYCLHRQGVNGILFHKSVAKEPLEDLGVGERLILKWISEEIRSGLSWLSTALWHVVANTVKVFRL
jgi:hypothetical protein